MNESPRTLGYRMPAEWEPHAATWLVWPQNRSDWPGRFAPIAWVYAEIVRYLSRAEAVHIIVDGPKHEIRATSVLQKSAVCLDNVAFHHWPTNRGWTRDSGPIFIKGGNSEIDVAITNWGFNGWAKYRNWSLDDGLPGHVASYLNFTEWTPTVGARRLVLEGGSIDVNGAGILLTTEECHLSDVQQRNPGLAREDLESAFRDYLGIDKVIWLGRGIAGDDTHGHIDDIARFVDAQTIVAVVEPNREDENHVPLKENMARLRAATNQKGHPFRIVELPMPAPIVFSGQRLPASYANFYVANGVVIVPTFGDPNDRFALEILAGVFSDRQVVGIHCRDLILGLGALHCMTLQQPA